LLEASGLEHTGFLNAILFSYHNLASFVLFTVGVIFFVVSLQEGFYNYQFK